MNGILNKIRPSAELENKLTLWMNHLLVIYTFLIPIHNKSKSSIFFVLLILFLYRMNYWKYLKEALSNKIVQAFLIFYFIHLLGFIYTENIDFAKSTMDKVKYILFPLFFLSFLDKRFSLRIIMAFILGVLLSVSISYLIYFNLIPNILLIGGFEIYEAQGISATPFFNHLDHKIGIAIATSFLLYSILNINSNLSRRKILFFIFLIIYMTINIVILGGRTGYILFIIMLFTVFILTYKKNIMKTISISILIIFSLISIIYSFSPIVKNESIQTQKALVRIIDNGDFNTSVGLRLGFTKYSLNVISENPILGVGTGDYMDEVRALFPKKHSYLNVIAQPHNVYIKILLQFGIVGLFTLFFIFYRIFTYKEYESIHNKNIMIILTIGIMVVMLPGKFFGVFVLPMYMVITSVMITKKIRQIEYSPMNLKSLSYYFIFTLLFLIIGITK